METRLHNISKTTNTADFTKTIPESFYKVLLAKYKLTALKGPVFLLGSLEFYATYGIYYIIAFAIFLEKY